MYSTRFSLLCVFHRETFLGIFCKECITWCISHGNIFLVNFTRNPLLGVVHKEFWITHVSVIEHELPVASVADDRVVVSAMLANVILTTSGTTGWLRVVMCGWRHVSLAHKPSCNEHSAICNSKVYVIAKTKQCPTSNRLFVRRPIRIY